MNRITLQLDIMRKTNMSELIHTNKAEKQKCKKKRIRKNLYLITFAAAAAAAAAAAVVDWLKSAVIDEGAKGEAVSPTEIKLYTAEIVENYAHMLRQSNTTPAIMVVGFDFLAFIAEIKFYTAEIVEN
uniref:Uncharacterized protein n=1 Tax=Glossina pallidipes TaxID=7398 RepID=A0A1A9ZKH8_GLOPL